MPSSDSEVLGRPNVEKEGSMQRARRRKRRNGSDDRLQRQRADEAAARARIAADAASAPPLPTLSENQPTVNEREREAAHNDLRHN